MLIAMEIEFGQNLLKIFRARGRRGKTVLVYGTGTMRVTNKCKEQVFNIHL